MATLIFSLTFAVTAVYGQTSVSSAPAPGQSLQVTTNGTCGPSVGMTCLGNPAYDGGQCCSSFGYCGSDDTYCGANCLASYGLCGDVVTPTSSSTMSSAGGTMSPSATSPVMSASGVTSTDGTCGGTAGYSCIGYSGGECCGSQWTCGSGPQFCLAGCQSAFGVCSNSNSSAVSSSPMWRTTGMPSNSTNGTWATTVTDCGCEDMTTTGATKVPTKAATYTGAAVPGPQFDIKGWFAASFIALVGFL